MKKTVFLLFVSILLFTQLPSLSGEQTVNSGPELESYICNGFRVSDFQIFVRNIGDETAHNVHIINATVEGNIFFNFQESHLVSYNIEPEDAARLSTNSMVFGFGNFTLSITVSCDEGATTEGATTTSSVVGLIFGPFMLIP